MKNIFLIGNSIRFGSEKSRGYEVFIREKYSDKFNIYSPNENCRFAQYTLRALCDWINTVDAKAIDVVYWNNGLWDVLRLNGDEPLTPIEVYIHMLERVYKKLRLFFPNAKIIFALTTQIIEADAPKDFMRYNAEIEEYNAEACKLMNKLNVQINDLYSIAKEFDNSYYADWTHFNDKGATILADEVIKTIERSFKNE